ncbi:MAG: hypothetical protein J6T37_01435 [Bacteroidales bacterium]|nr:hypothetical protein [Bacteroidaceae bacterium]MBO5707687.1 hypothetical protein [Bacteroidaceae bacterium]MBO7528258.1 hypothetical protein [Bacteroidales bacterium]MBO7528519.1 hypothetical protein [Bacteroidales bacterium]
MVIIKTDAGTRFINENECLQINHNETNRCVEVWPKGEVLKTPQYYLIENVSQVRYVSPAHDIEFDSKENFIAELIEKIKDESFRAKHINVCYNLLRNFCMRTLLKNEALIDDEKNANIMDEWLKICERLKEEHEKIKTRCENEEL